MNEDQMFWVVWNPKAGPPTFEHDSASAARAEATRLARQNPGERFYVLAAVGLAHRPEPTVFKALKAPAGIELDEIPF